MKLHLPSGLRKSLLACLAALALPSLPVTLSSASALLSGAAVFSFVAADQAVAAPDLIFDDGKDLENGEHGELGDDYATHFNNLILNSDGTALLDGMNYWWIIDGEVSGKGSLTLSSPVMGYGMMEFKNGGEIGGGLRVMTDVTYKKDDNGEWKEDVRDGIPAVVYIGHTLSIGGLSNIVYHHKDNEVTQEVGEWDKSSSMAFFALDDTSKLVVDVAQERSFTMGGRTDVGSSREGALPFEKVGKGEQVFENVANFYGSVTVKEGALRLLSSESSISGNISIAKDAVLEVTRSGSGVSFKNSMVTLDGGTLIISGDGREQEVTKMSAGTLIIGENGGKVEFGEGYKGGTELVFGGLTSEGEGNASAVLALPEMTKTDVNLHEWVDLGNITNFNGTITGSTGNSTNYNEVSIGTVNLAKDYTTTINVAGKGVVTKEFLKSGEGRLVIQGGGLVVNGTVHMDYEGEMEISSITVEGRSKLLYKTGSEDHLVPLTLDSLVQGDTYILDVMDVWLENEELLHSGMSLGITGDGTTSLDELKARFELAKFNDTATTWQLMWSGVDNKTLYLTILDGQLEGVKENWDKNWGDSERLRAPSADFLDDAEYSTYHNSNGDFIQNSLVLDQNRTYNETTQTFVRITGGGGGRLGTGGSDGTEMKYFRIPVAVIGGRLYINGTDYPDTDTVVAKDSYISMLVDDGGSAYYHLLVGGSSCVHTSSDATNMGEAFGGFIGNSHIQMRGGEVDYIVGGNHVNNSSFIFRGNSYISIMSGSRVNGGIVGGSTLTRGSANSTVYAFQGNSNIFVYTLLTNDGEYELPGISDGTASQNDGRYASGAAFTAIVGGNAWIDLSDSAGNTVMNPTFRGKSRILIDLTEIAADGSFEKDIVGGNYTATEGSTEGAGNRNTVFNAGNRETVSEITIEVPEERDVKFTGGINGASRRASVGAGTTYYTGSTLIDITGGSYVNYIAGGLWFDETANGSHNAELEGNTMVELHRGNFWRVLGGGVSMGGAGNSSENQKGDSGVLVRGGVFSTAHTDIAGEEALEQTAHAFVAGGDFYRNNRGGTGADSDGNMHTGDTTVRILPSGDDAVRFTDAHIVGGDYVNSSTAESSNRTNSVVSGISGVSGVVIGDSANNEGTAKISGLVVGGSWLTDTGAAGEVNVGDTMVVVYDGELSSTEVHTDDTNWSTGKDGKNGHYHLGLAVVGGNVLIDEGATEAGTSGAHKAIVQGRSHIEIGGAADKPEGPSITGDVVGGSYANRTAGVNTLTTGGVQIDIKSGNIAGNVYGGHFTESVNAPDTLKMGDVRISMMGGKVEGNIVGGGYRAAVKDENGSSEQGAIELLLEGGTLEGNVYAAGYNDVRQMSNKEGSARTHTDSTLVSIGDDFVFAGVTEERPLVISGGYGRAVESMVRRGSVDSARLEVGNNASLANSRAYLSLQDFDTVSTEMDLKLATELVVLRTNTQESLNHFTKEGSGVLKVRRLAIADTVDKATQEYTGKITVMGGELQLVSRQSVLAGMSFGLEDLARHTSAAHAYLQSEGGLTLGLTGDSTRQVHVELLGAAELLTSVDYGAYYLAAGLEDDVELSDFRSNLDELNEALTQVNDGMLLELLLEDGNLVLMVKDTVEQKLFHWAGDTASRTWSDDSRSAWKESLTGESPAGHNVYFDANGEGQGGAVTVEGEVTPRSIWVKSGEYTFTAKDDKAALNVGGNANNKKDYGSDGVTELAGQLEEGELAIGGSDQEASLTLAVAAKRVDRVLLKDMGTLTLAHKDALTTAAEIVFNGGMLDYGDAQSFGRDVSGQVSLSDSTDLARVRVGKGGAVTWGTPKTLTEGVELILTKGLEKTGEGSLLVEWSGEGGSMKGSIAVAEGELTYKMHAAQNAEPLTISGTDAAGSNVISVGDDAHLTLVADGGSMRLARKFVGAGKVTLASEGSANVPAFTVEADNGAFEGTLELMGSGTVGSVADAVYIQSGTALGGADTALVLSGRHIVAMNAVDGVSVKSITVTSGTVNVVGGTEWNQNNGTLTLSAGQLDGSGALSNAWGNGSVGFRHVLAVEDLSDFSGALIAGDGRSRGTSLADTLSSWTVQCASGGDLSLRLAGGGTIVTAFTGARTTRLLGKIGSSSMADNNTTSLDHTGAGELVLANEENSATGTITTHKDAGAVRLGDMDDAGAWGGQLLKGDGTLVLTNGVLKNGGITNKTDSSRLLVETVNTDSADVSTTVDVGGMAGKMIDGITLTAGGQLINVGGDITLGTSLSTVSRVEREVAATLTLGAANVGAEATTTEKDHMIVMSSGNVVVNEGEALCLDFTNDGLMSVLTRVLNGGETGEAWLHIVANGDLVIDPELYGDLLAVGNSATGRYSALLGVLGYEVVGVQGGDLGIIGNEKDVYLVLRDDVDGDLGDSPLVESYGVISERKATVIDRDKTLTINLTGKPEAGEDHNPDEVSGLEADVAAGGAVVNNLVGLAGSKININNGAWLAWRESVEELEQAADDSLLGEDGELELPEAPDFTDADNRVKVIFNNTAQPNIKDEGYAEARGIDTLFEGTITAGEGVDLGKSGAGMLTIGSAAGDGGLQLATGDMRIDGGALKLQAKENTLRSVTFGYAGPAEADEEGAVTETRGLVLANGHTRIGSIVEDSSSKAGRLGADVTLMGGAELSLTGKSYLSDTVIMQAAGDEATGTLSIEDGALLALGALAEEPNTEGEEPAPEAKTLAPEQIVGLNLQLKSGGKLDMGLGRASVKSLRGGGELSGTGGVLAITDKPEKEVIFSGTMSGTGTLQVQQGAGLTFKDAIGGNGWNVDNAGSLVIDLESNRQNLTVGDLTLRSGSTTSLKVNTDHADEMSTIEANMLQVERGAAIVVNSSGRNIITQNEIVLGHVVTSPSRSSVQEAELTLNGVVFLHYEAEDSSLYLNGSNLVLGLASSENNKFISDDMEKNAKAGAVLFWEASDTATSDYWAEIAKDPDSDLYKMMVGLVNMLDAKQAGQLNRTLAAGAGASTSVLSSALSQDVERQLRTIRNRTTTMGSEARYDGNDELPLYHMWLTGEGAYHKMSADGLAPGYTLNSWGGTVGVDADVSEHATVGLAVSAMYGDLKTDAADSARGDMTTTWLSGFARVSYGAWMHTLVMTAGLADVKLDRTVGYGTGYYNTRGRTDGYQLGALYEVGYARSLNNAGSAVLQGVANVEVRYASLNAYEESGSDAALSVETMDHTVITFGVGGRFQSVVAENALNRAALFEARALLKADVGDRSSKTSNALLRGSATRQEVESAEVGVLGVELGAGITIPVGRKGSFFIDASAELRSGYTEMNANAGYRVSF